MNGVKERNSKEEVADNFLKYKGNIQEDFFKGVGGLKKELKPRILRLKEELKLAPPGGHEKRRLSGELKRTAVEYAKGIAALRQARDAKLAPLRERFALLLKKLGGK